MSCQGLCLCVYLQVECESMSVKGYKQVSVRMWVHELSSRQEVGG